MGLMIKSALGYVLLISSPIYYVVRHVIVENTGLLCCYNFTAILTFTR
jgi:hypothetical protein